MKKGAKFLISFLTLAAFASLAQAANPGSYAGVDVGETTFQTLNESLFNVNTPGENFFVPASTEENLGKPSSPHSAKLGGRLFGGYNFNSYFGIETGFARYARSKYLGNIGTANSSLQYTMNAFDLMLKAYLPLGEGNLNIYASGALARARATSKYNNSDIPFMDDLAGLNEGIAMHNNKMRPVIGIGTSYDIPRTDFTTGIEFNRFQGSEDIQTNPDAIPASDMLTFNLSYHLD